MSVTPQTPAVVEPVKPKPRRNGRWSGYSRLLMARMLELKREPEVVFWVFVFPLLLALGLGIAFRNKPGNAVSVAVARLDTGQPSLFSASNIRLMLSQSTLYKFNATLLSDEEARKGFRLGKYELIVETAGDFETGKGIQYVYDPARPESVLAKAEVDDALQAAAGRKDTVATTAVPSSEPGSRYIDFLIPGLLGMNLMNSGMWGIGFALVDMRQRKLLKRFVGTPMRRTDFLLALASSRLILMIIEVGLLLGFGALVFQMRILGSIMGILLLGAVGALSFAGLGLLTASRAQKIESVSGLINLVMMPMWIFSGVFFSYERVPQILQPVIRALPLTALNDALRAIILQGASPGSQWSQIAVMAVWGGVSFVLALKWFRWS